MRAPIDENHHKGIGVADSTLGSFLPVSGEDLTNANPMHVAIVDGSGNQITTFGGSGGTSSTDDSAFTAGTGTGTPAMGYTGSDTVDTGDVGVVGMLNNRQQKVTLYDSAGNELAVGGGTQYTEDAAAAANPIGNAVNLIRADTPATVTTTDGDNISQRGTNYGAAYTQVVTSTGAFVDTFGGGTQYSDGDANVDPTGTVAMGTDGANVFALHTDTAGDLQIDVLSSALPTGASTSALQTAGNASLTTIAGAVAGTEMQVDVITMPTVTVQATDLDTRNLVFATDKVDASGTTLGANSGTDIGDVTVNNAAGASAVNIQDGGNSITVDGTVGLSAGTNNIGDVDVLTVNGVAPAFGSGVRGATVQRVTIATDDLVPVSDNGGSLTVDGTVTANAGSGTFTVAGAVTNTVLSVVGGGTEATAQRVTIANDSTGVLSVDDNGGSLTVDGTVAATQSGTWTVQPGNTANTTAWLVNDQPATSGGLSKFHLVGAATDNATNVKASAGQVYSITAFNVAATPRYLKFHNTAGTPTAGSGVTDTFLIPGNTAGAGVVLNIDKGIAFSTGIGISIVTGIADANTTAIGASEVVVNVYYK